MLYDKVNTRNLAKKPDYVHLATKSRFVFWIPTKKLTSAVYGKWKGGNNNKETKNMSYIKGERV